MADLRNILQTIFDDPHELSEACRECQAELYVYVDTELAGEKMGADFEKVRGHLDGCDICRQTYTELKALLLNEQQNQFVTPPVAPEFDFSYLEKGTDARSVWQVFEEAGRQIKRLFVAVPVHLSKKRVSFGQLPTGLNLETLTTPAMRGESVPSESMAQLLSLSSAEDDIDFGLRVGPMAEGKATLGIQLKQASSQQALNKARVTLRDSQRRMLESHTVSNTTEITIHDVGKGSYLVEIKYKNKIWELPLTISTEDEAAIRSQRCTW